MFHLDCVQPWNVVTPNPTPHVARSNSSCPSIRLKSISANKYPVILLTHDATTPQPHLGLREGKDQTTYSLTATFPEQGKTSPTANPAHQIRDQTEQNSTRPVDIPDKLP